jgi:hypothetical protein
MNMQELSNSIKSKIVNHGIEEGEEVNAKDICNIYPTQIQDGD